MDLPKLVAFDLDGTLAWTTLWSEEIPASERATIVSALGIVAREMMPRGSVRWGAAVEDRTSQVTLSLLGHAAPLGERERWAAANGVTLTRVYERARDMLSAYTVRRGGLTSVDVTLPGWDKGRGLARLLRHLGLEVADVLYVGDRLGQGGNDRPVLDIGVRCLETSGPEQTATIIRSLLQG